MPKWMLAGAPGVLLAVRFTTGATLGIRSLRPSPFRAPGTSREARYNALDDAACLGCGCGFSLPETEESVLQAL
ncbi:hypothetical protein NDU88_005272 [Pleurodeles waltl]|uniref:Uncharacterized protein n=1 Tax=Pleurodeles waltl TaxID=8319 RepID=A0AAV7M8U6_PLEWA|nr:hypothetical protein NDU88_005272 [Pleurodeles waltl]